MPRLLPKRPQRLEDLPNIGKAIAADLRRAGIHQPEQLVKRDPLETFHELSAVMGRRQDPCVLLVDIHGTGQDVAAIRIESQASSSG